MIISHLIEVSVISLLGFLLWRENKRRDDVQSQQEGGLEGRDLDSTAFSDMTDRENLKYVFPTQLCTSNTQNPNVLFLLKLLIRCDQ